MSLEKYLSKSIQLNEDRVKHCLEMGGKGEDLFKELTSAIKTDVAEDKQHIDFYWEGRRVDVKGPKPMHSRGYILLEMINIWGHHGWCSKESKADYIAFQFPNAFYVFEKTALRNKVVSLCEKYEPSKVRRQNRVKESDGKYKWIGRYGKQDVFTYLEFDDVKDIIYDTISI
jgi:hypothetical protein